MSERKIVRVEDKKSSKLKLDLSKIDIDADELADLAEDLLGYVKKNPDALKDLKKKPVQTIAEFLAFQKASDATKNVVQKLVEDQDDGDMLSVLGSLSGLLDSGKSKSTAKKAKGNDALTTITSLLGNDTAQDALGSLLDAFTDQDEKKTTKKTTKKSTSKSTTAKKATTKKSTSSKKKTTTKKTSSKKKSSAKDDDTLDAVLDLVGTLLK